MSGSSKETVLDTSTWLAVAEGDPRARRLPDVQAERTAVLSVLSFAELASLLQRGRIEGARLEAVVQGVRMEQVEARDCLEGGKLHGQLRRGGNTKVSLVDCIIYASARRLGVALITLDHDLEGLPGVEILQTPGKKA